MTTSAEPQVTVETPDGPVTIRGAIYAKWQALGAEMTPDGDTAQAHLEHPLGPQVAVAAEHGGGAMQLFRRGLIVAGEDGLAFVVYGAIYDHYLAIGGPAGELGPPTSDEENAGRGGRVSHFRSGDVYWRSDVGVREVYGGRRRRFAARGYPFTITWTERAAAAYRRVRRLVFRPARRPG
jgi:uncharacterized protein with LGFP repeats